MQFYTRHIKLLCVYSILLLLFGCTTVVEFSQIVRNQTPYTIWTEYGVDTTYIKPFQSDTVFYDYGRGTVYDYENCSNIAPISWGIVDDSLKIKVDANSPDSWVYVEERKNRFGGGGICNCSVTLEEEYISD